MIIERTIVELSAEAFAPFGTVIEPTPDGVPFGPGDAQLQLDRGVPRFYIMTIPGRGLQVSAITRHRQVTQALAAAGGGRWVLAVAPPGEVDNPEAQPELDEIVAFSVPGDVAVMLEVGTWHAGPLFEGGERDFFNLELADTNVVDHHTCDLVASYGAALALV